MKKPTTKQSQSSSVRPAGDDFFISSAFPSGRAGGLKLADGTWAAGELIGAAKPQLGEVVFTTGMTGYVETLTDPSYAGQIIVFTYPLIGNYGVPPREQWESGQIHAAGVVVNELAPAWSHAGSEQSLASWLAEEQVPVLHGVDTRALTKDLREHGTMLGILGERPARRVPQMVEIPKVSIDQPKLYNGHHRRRVVLVDCGLKENILRSLLQFPVAVLRVPAEYDYTTEQFDGVLISNGPGDPTDYRPTVRILKKALRPGRPVFGICLGSQLLALAAGAKTYKLVFGHRGHNQPCRSADGRDVVTSQNHGYAIDAKTLPRGWQTWFSNLNDGSVEGILHATQPWSAVQFHPEASPGPTDTADLFKRFYGQL